MNEPLPPMLYEDWLAFCIECKGLGQLQDKTVDGLIKLGYELAYQQLKPMLKAALPYYETGLRDTRLGQADAHKLAELAAYQEVASHGQ